MPYLCLSGHHVSGNAEERNWKILEIHRILIAYSEGTYQIGYILTVNVSGRKAAKKILLQKLHPVFVIVCTDMKHIILMHRIKTVFVSDHLPVIILLIEERNGKEILLLVFHVSI